MWQNVKLTEIKQGQEFPGGSDGKASVYNVGDLGSKPWVGKIPWRRKWQPNQYYCLENPMGGGAWQDSPWGHKELDTTE